MAKLSTGGNVVKAESKAAAENVPKCCMVTVGIEGTRKPETFAAKNMDEFVAKVPKTFTTELRKSDGSTSKEKLEISKFEDIGLDAINQNSEVLKGQQIEKNFLYRFLEEWRNNPAFKSQFLSIISDPKRKQQVIAGLKEVRDAIEKDESPTPLMTFLNNH